MGLGMKMTICFGLAGIFVFCVQHIVRVMYISGMFVQRHNHQPGLCRIVPGIDFGSEDIQTLPNGVALITAGLHDNSPSEARGIYRFDFNSPDLNVTKVPLYGPVQSEDLVPYGLSLWKDEISGEITVFLINHGPGYVYNESVEVFRYDEVDYSLHHLRTIRDPHFVRLNDVVATSNSTFYATNDCLWFTSHWKWAIETFLQSPLGNVVFYDGTHAKPASRRYVLPNGINRSNNNKYIYLIVYGESKMVVYKRNSDNSLEEVKTVPLRMSKANNIELDHDGDLWIAGGYNVLGGDTIRSTSPNSLVIRGKEIDGEYHFSEVYVNDGSELDDCTVASHYKSQLLLGTAYHKLLYCDLRKEDRRS